MVKSRPLRRMGGPGGTSSPYASRVDARHSLWLGSFDFMLATPAGKNVITLGTPGYVLVSIQEGAVFLFIAVSGQNLQFAHNLVDSLT